MVDMMPKCWYKPSKPHLFCPGCGHGIALKQLGFAIDEMDVQKDVVFGIDIGCSLLAWDFLSVDTIQTHHGRTTPVMVGYKMTEPNKIALAYMGDGGGYAIGLQSLLHAAYRNDPVTAILINNTNYAMTGGQMAPTTLPGQITSTSPSGKSEKLGLGFDGPKVIRSVARDEAYISRVTVNNPDGIKSAFKKAIESQTKDENFAFVEVLSTCPTNWKTDAKESFKQVKDLEKEFSLGEF